MTILKRNTPRRTQGSRLIWPILALLALLSVATLALLPYLLFLLLGVLMLAFLLKTLLASAVTRSVLTQDVTDDPIDPQQDYMDNREIVWTSANEPPRAETWEEYQQRKNPHQASNAAPPTSPTQKSTRLPTNWAVIRGKKP